MISLIRLALRIHFGLLKSIGISSSGIVMASGLILSDSRAWLPDRPVPPAGSGPAPGVRGRNQVEGGSSEVEPSVESSCCRAFSSRSLRNDEGIVHFFIVFVLIHGTKSPLIGPVCADNQNPL